MSFNPKNITTKQLQGSIAEFVGEDRFLNSKKFHEHAYYIYILIPREIIIDIDIAIVKFYRIFEKIKI